jgi:hypothetical protein
MSIANLTGCLCPSIETKTLQVTTGASSGRVLTSDASGNATWQVPSGGGGVTSVTNANGTNFSISGGSPTVLTATMQQNLGTTGTPSFQTVALTAGSAQLVFPHFTISQMITPPLGHARTIKFYDPTQNAVDVTTTLQLGMRDFIEAFNIATPYTLQTSQSGVVMMMDDFADTPFIVNLPNIASVIAAGVQFDFLLMAQSADVVINAATANTVYGIVDCKGTHVLSSPTGSTTVTCTAPFIADKLSFIADTQGNWNVSGMCTRTNTVVFS